MLCQDYAYIYRCMYCTTSTIEDWQNVLQIVVNIEQIVCLDVNNIKKTTAVVSCTYFRKFSYLFLYKTHYTVEHI
jgi:hypothetical protein